MIAGLPSRVARLAAAAALLLGAGASGARGQELSIDDVMVVEGDAGTVNAVFTVTLQFVKGQSVSVDFQTQDGTATEADGDYIGTAGTLFFPGKSDPELQFVMVPIVGDTTFEADETFQVNLSNAMGAQIVDGTGVGQILNDDVLTLSISDVAVTEGDAGTVDAVFDVTLSGQPIFEDVTVDFATRDGTATVADGDYDAASGTLLFPAPARRGGRALGPVDQQVAVTVNGDTQVEASEVFFVDLTNAMGATIVDGVGDGTILNDDLPTLAIGDASVVEGDAGSVMATFTVSLSDPPEDDVTVDFATRDGTATTADGDYAAAAGSLTFTPTGPPTQDVTVAVNGDTKAEPDETFFVDLTNPAGATIADGEGAGTIVNDDVVTISVDDVAVTEGDSGSTGAVFSVVLSNPSASVVSVDVATRNGTATAPDDDYFPTSGVLSFSPGVTVASFTVNVRGDTRVEPDETYFVDLSNPSGGSIGDGEGLGTILDDDEEDGGGGEEEVSEIRLIDAPDVGEAAGTAAVTVERTGTTGSARITVNAMSGSATAGEDFTPLSEVVTWGAGETGPRVVEVGILDDNLEEGDEAVRIELTNPVGAVVAGASGADLAILDDDEPMAIEPVGDDETLSLVNGEVGLQVLVRRDDGSPVQGARVFWAVEEGEAELIGGEATASDADGIAANEVRLGGTPGTVVVTAALEGGDVATTFEITVQGDLEGLVDPATSPGEASVAAVLDASCIEARGSFAEACEYLFGLEDPADRLRVLRQLTPREVAAQGTLSIDAMRVQLRNVSGRLADLRDGGGGGALDQLAFRSERDGFTLGQLRTDPRTRADAAFLRRIEGAWWDDTTSEEPGAGTIVEEESSRWGLFVNGSIAVGKRSDTVGEEGFDLETFGLTAGVDVRLNDRAVVGGAIGWLDTDVSLVRNGGGLGADGVSASAYTLLYGESLYFTGVVTLGRLDFDLERAIDLPEAFQGSDRFLALAATEADQLSIALEGGYDRALGAATLGGFVRLSSVDAEIEGYSEGGAGPFALAILGQDVESLLAETGVSWSLARSRPWGVVQPALHVAWLHEFEDSSRLVRGRFVEDLEAREFLVPTDAPDRDYLNLGAGLTMTLTRGRSLFLYYDTDLERDDLELYTFSFGLRWEL